MVHKRKRRLRVQKYGSQTKYLHAHKKLTRRSIRFVIHHGQTDCLAGTIYLFLANCSSDKHSYEISSPDFRVDLLRIWPLHDDAGAELCSIADWFLQR